MIYLDLLFKVRFVSGGFDIVTVTGLGFNPLTRQWRTSSDLSINYAVTAIKRNLNEINEDDFDDNYEIR